MFTLFACFARQTFLIALVVLGCGVMPSRGVLAQLTPCPPGRGDGEGLVVDDMKKDWAKVFPSGGKND